MRTGCNANILFFVVELIAILQFSQIHPEPTPSKVCLSMQNLLVNRIGLALSKYIKLEIARRTHFSFVAFELRGSNRGQHSDAQILKQVFGLAETLAFAFV